MGSCCGLDTLPGRFPSVSPHKHQLPSNSWFARLAPVQAPLRVYPHTSYSTVPPCLQNEVRQHPRAGQQRHTQTEKQAGYSPAAFSAECGAVGRCEGCEHDTKSAPVPAHNVLPLVSSVTGGSRPGHVPGSSGVVPPKAGCRTLAPNASLSGQLLLSALLRLSHFDGDTISPVGGIVKGGTQPMAPSGRELSPKVTEGASGRQAVASARYESSASLYTPPTVEIPFGLYHNLPPSRLRRATSLPEGGFGPGVTWLSYNSSLSLL